MSSQKYDFLDDEHLGSSLFNVNDLHKKAKEKELSRNKIYFKISKKCFDKIKDSSENDQTYCFFKVPEYIPGFPLFNMTQCVLYLLNLLKEKGFHSRYVDGYVIYISWNIPNPQYKAIENVKPRKTIETLPLKYKPIEQNNLKNFIPRKRS